MTMHSPKSHSSLALLTDLYQLTMAYGYWKTGRCEQPAVFHLFFRESPFQGGFAVAAGIEPVKRALANFRFASGDLDYLATLVGSDERPLFESGFLDYLAKLRLGCDIDAVLEGTIVFPQEPILRVRGPILQGQILESILLNIVNFQTLIATKAARICYAARGEEVLEFGLRRAQSIDGALSASRAAYIGGCAATSNVLAGKLYGIPVRGTHAHSWVMSFDSEDEAFDAYADAMPNNCVFLVDTYDTLRGVKKAAEVGRRLREKGHEMVGIRLDSGDLAYLSGEARRILDEAGFPDARIVASNDLDEHLIENLKHQHAKIAVWGVGTRLVTAYDQPALGGVYKLGAMQESPGRWLPKIKVSEQLVKTTIPGILQVRRFARDGVFLADMIYDQTDEKEPGRTIVDPRDPTRSKRIAEEAERTDLLENIVRDGQIVGRQESLETIRRRVSDQLTKLHPSIRRLKNPHEYPVGLDAELFAMRDRMIRQARRAAADAT